MTVSLDWLAASLETVFIPDLCVNVYNMFNSLFFFFFFFLTIFDFGVLFSFWGGVGRGDNQVVGVFFV